MTVENNLDSSTHLKRTIQILPEHLIDQIKAGEVIERSSSLLKEILENSIDAEATEISLHLINNGLDLISLTDNGKGMIFEELPYAFCRHATSKISRFEDIYRLHSYGFRGEALASICAISRVTCTSSPAENSPQGGKIIIEGGETKAHAPMPNAPKGTSLYIKDLFFNTPARLKFIKSATSEKNALKRIIDSFVIGHPEIKFTIKWDDQDKEVFPIEQSFEERLKKLFHKRQKTLELHKITGEYEGHSIEGYFSGLSTKGSTHKKQFLFANDRLFTDRQIHQTVLRSMERLYPQGESGHYCIFIKAPENLIDVNIHPSKTQIRFFKLPVITALISSEIKKVAETLPEREVETEVQGSFNYSQSQQNHSHFHNHSLGQSSSSSPKSYPRPTYSHLGNADTTRETFNLSSQSEHHLTFDHDLSVMKIQEKEVLFSRVRFFSEFFRTLAKQSFHPDKDFVPLLISEPVFLPEGQRVVESELEKHGLLVEVLSHENLVIRAVHQNLRNWNDLQSLVLFLLTQNEICLEGVHISEKDYLCLTEGLPLNPSSYMRDINSSLYDDLF